MKTRIRIKQAKDTAGRLIYLVDKQNKTIFLIDVYYHSKTTNHNKEIIKEAYEEYTSNLAEI